MSAPATVNPVAPPAPAPSRPVATATSATDENRFDRHLDAARQQHGEANEQPAHEEHDPAAKAPATAKADHAQATDAPAKDESHPDAAALAAAMLALIGQAAPAKPLAQAGAVAPATAKAAGAVGTAAKTPAALVLLAGTAAATAVATAKPATGLDTAALAPMLAKPAEQKDAPLDALQMATASTTQVPTPGNAGTAAPPATLNIASPAGTPAFAQELGQHVMWLGQQDVKQARIRLHPEDLGTLDVKVSLNHDRVDVSFAVQHPAAVHAVQQTLPQLDALLAHHGLALGHTDVGQRQQQGEGGRGGEAGGTIGEIEPESVAMASAPVVSLGMLDTFA